MLTIWLGTEFVGVQPVPEDRKSVRDNFRLVELALVAEHESASNLHLVPGEVFVFHSFAGGMDSGNWLEHHEIGVGPGDSKGVVCSRVLG